MGDRGLLVLALLALASSSPLAAESETDSTNAALRDEISALKQTIAAFKSLPTYQAHKTSFVRDVSKTKTANCRAANAREAGQGICGETLIQLSSEASWKQKQKEEAAKIASLPSDTLSSKEKDALDLKKETRAEEDKELKKAEAGGGAAGGGGAEDCAKSPDHSADLKFLMNINGDCKEKACMNSTSFDYYKAGQTCVKMDNHHIEHVDHELSGSEQGFTDWKKNGKPGSNKQWTEAVERTKCRIEKQGGGKDIDFGKMWWCWNKQTRTLDVPLGKSGSAKVHGKSPMVKDGPFVENKLDDKTYAQHLQEDAVYTKAVACATAKLPDKGDVCVSGKDCTLSGDLKLHQCANNTAMEDKGGDCHHCGDGNWLHHRLDKCPELNDAQKEELTDKFIKSIHSFTCSEI